MTEHTELYERLGVDPDATGKEIREAYLYLSKLMHPDKGGAEADFKRLVAAYEVLKDKGKRARYNATGELDDKLEEGAVGILSILIAKMLMSEDGPGCMNFVAWATDNLETEIEKMTLELKAPFRALAHIDDARDRFTKTDADAPDVFSQILDSHRDDLEQNIAQAERKIRMHEMAKAILENFDYRADESVAQNWTQIQVASFGGFTTSSSTSG